MKYHIPAGTHLWRFGRFNHSWEQLRSTKAVTYTERERILWEQMHPHIVTKLKSKIRPGRIEEIVFFVVPFTTDYEWIAVDHRRVREVP